MMTLLLTLSLISVSPAHAIDEKACPERLALSIRDAFFLTNAEIRTHERHANFTSTMFRDVFTSRNRLERLLGLGWTPGEFALAARNAGECVYENGDRAVDANRVVLFTQDGIATLKHEVRLAQKERPDESFSFQAVITAYSTDGVELSEIGSRIFTTVDTPCLFGTCVSEALIGHATLATETEVPPTVGAGL